MSAEQEILKLEIFLSRATERIKELERDLANATTIRSLAITDVLVDAGQQLIAANRRIAALEAERDAEALEVDERGRVIVRYQQRIAELETSLNQAGVVAEIRRKELDKLKQALENADRELTDLQPHIPQACYPGHERFIDTHVDAAQNIIRDALAAGKEEQPHLHITDVRIDHIKP